MPLCLMYTNLKRSEFDANIEERLAKCISEVSQISLEYIFVVIHSELPAFCAGSRDPPVICQVHAKNIFDAGQNVDAYYPKLFETIKETTKVPGNRIVVELIAVPDALAQIGQ